MVQQWRTERGTTARQICGGDECARRTNAVERSNLQLEASRAVVMEVRRFNSPDNTATHRWLGG
ncbi:importin-11 [Sesbania bispinosa]|nr:importin-11 [Sesbania bispinosa]